MSPAGQDPPRVPRTGSRMAAGAASGADNRDRRRRLSARRASRADDKVAAAYDFLLDGQIDATTLARAGRIARRWRTTPHRVLIALGWISLEAYVAALARSLGVDACALPTPHPLAATVIDATAYTPDEIDILVRHERTAGRAVLLGSASVSTRGKPLTALPDDEAIVLSTHGLEWRRPELSTAKPVWLWQRLASVILGGMMIGGAAVAPEETLAALLSLMAFPFVLVTVIRLLALWNLCFPGWSTDRRAGRDGEAARLVPDSLLPIYTVLVPLYDEAEIVGDLLAALIAIDYPAERLDILILVEISDTTTRVRLNAERLPDQIRVLVVPAGKPRTKPRALNFGLQHARGDFVVVFDAEDMPEPDQLRRAWDALRARPERFGCVQARLNIYNPGESWLSRQFTIEYSALFDGLLPTLERFDLPIPLGGTSNHFPRPLLVSIGGWDAYNVTEDADLGVRLARQGWRVAVIGSTTWEEAPASFGVWLKQRTRWLKGWMLTTLVHTRRPLRLMIELGELRFLSLLALLGGLILAALVHPWFYVMIAVDLWQGGLLRFPDSMLGQSIWGLAALNLLVGYATAMLLGIAAAIRRGRPGLVVHVLLLPFYWLAISLAAYRAVIQLVRDPYLWEKTPHSRHSRKGRTKR